MVGRNRQSSRVGCCFDAIDGSGRPLEDEPTVSFWSRSQCHPGLTDVGGRVHLSGLRIFWHVEAGKGLLARTND